MEQNDLVSIGIPAYKGEFLFEAIESALNQTYSNIEVIIVNDCSPQNLDAIVSKFNDKRIRYYVNEKNLGFSDPVANWNKCLSLAKGPFFCLLCDDDIYEPKFVEEMISLKRKYNHVNVFRSRVKIIDSNRQIVDLYPSSPEYESCFNYMWAKLAGVRRQTISEFMYDTDYIKSIGGFVPLPKAWGSDDISCFKFSLEHGIVTTNKLLVSFRMSGLNISSSSSKNVKEKINATISYEKKIDELLTSCLDSELCNLIQQKKVYNFNLQIEWCLISAKYLDFLRYFFYNSISKKILIRAFIKKIIRFLKHTQ